MSFFSFLGSAAKTVGHDVLAVDKAVLKPFSFLSNVGQQNPLASPKQQVQTFKNFATGAGHVAQDVVTRGPVQAGLSITAPITHRSSVQPADLGTFGRILFGDQPINTIQSQYSQQRSTGTGLLPAVGLAGLTGIGDILPPFGGGGVAKDLVKAATAEDATKALIKGGVDAATARRIAPAIANTKDPNIINNIIDKAHAPPPSPASADIHPTSVEPTSTAAGQGIVHPELKAAVENVGNKADIAKLPTAADTEAGINGKQIAQSARSSYIGELDKQRLAGTHLNEALKKVAPDEQGAIFWYREANGNSGKLQEALANPKFEAYHEDIQKALNLSPEAKQASQALDVAYQKTGEAATAAGTIKGALQEYGNSRFYVQEPGGGTNLSSTLRQGTGSAQSRKFEDAFQAVEAGKQFATTNAADAFALHNSELARVNTTRKLLDTMQTNGLGKWTTGTPPEGWSRVEGVSKSGAFNDENGVAHSVQYNFTAPKEIADRMAALTKTDALKRSGFFRGSAAYQGLVKTLDLSFSLFHHLTMTVQALSQTKLGYDVVKNWDKIGHTDSTEFRKLELQAVKDGGLRTTKVAANQDISRSLFSHSNNTWIDTIKEAPVAKQVLSAAHVSTSILFDKMQRYLKVMDWHGKMEKWIANNPHATQDEYLQASRGYGKEINAAYGGLNWEALGITKTQQSVLRAVLLAPDWVISNASLIKYIGAKGTAGSAARQHIFTALVSGMVATEAINKAVTGHFTDQNQKGHWSEIELAPGVHLSLIRGGPGELLKIMSNIYDKGPATGVGSFAQGKESPFARTLTGLLTGKNYFGQAITGGATSLPGKALGEGKFIASNLIPIPFGGQSGYSYTKNAIQEHSPINPVALGASATGLARYTNPNPGVSKPQKDILAQLKQENAPQNQIDSYKAFFKVKSPSSTEVNNQIDQALKNNDYNKATQLATDYNAKIEKVYSRWAKQYGNDVPDDLYSRYQGKYINPDGFDARLDKLSTPILSR